MITYYIEKRKIKLKYMGRGLARGCQEVTLLSQNPRKFHEFRITETSEKRDKEGLKSHLIKKISGPRFSPPSCVDK